MNRVENALEPDGKLRVCGQDDAQSSGFLLKQGLELGGGARLLELRLLQRLKFSVKFVSFVLKILESTFKLAELGSGIVKSVLRLAELHEVLSCGQRQPLILLTQTLQLDVGQLIVLFDHPVLQDMKLFLDFGKKIGNA